MILLWNYIVPKGRSWDYSVPWDFNGTSLGLPWQSNGNSLGFLWDFDGTDIGKFRGHAVRS